MYVLLFCFVFLFDSNNFIRLNILRVVQQSEKHLDKILNVDEFLRRIFGVIHSNDPIARAIEMSALAGMDITPDAGSTLRKVIKLRLDNFLDQFEVISGAASKVPCHNKTKRCTTTQSRRKQLCPCL